MAAQTCCVPVVAPLLCYWQRLRSSVNGDGERGMDQWLCVVNVKQVRGNGRFQRFLGIDGWLEMMQEEVGGGRRTACLQPLEDADICQQGQCPNHSRRTLWLLSKEKLCPNPFLSSSFAHFMFFCPSSSALVLIVVLFSNRWLECSQWFSLPSSTHTSFTELLNYQRQQIFLVQIRFWL